MSDLVARLRRWTHDAAAAPASDLMDEAADEIARLHLELSVQKSCTVAGRNEIARLKLLANGARLTPDEREALTWFTGGRGPICPQHLATIRGLMDRL
jgi:hypothetical protein